MNNFISLKTEKNSANTKHPLPSGAATGDKKYEFYSTINGFRQAARAMGNSHSFKICLNKIYREYKNDETGRKKQYQPQIDALRNRNEILEQSLAQKKAVLEKLKYDHPEKSEIAQLEAQIQQLEQEIKQLRTDPSGVPADESDFNRWKLWGAGLLSIMLGVYLFNFYISVSYSAFFKNILLDSQQMLGRTSAAFIFNTIFDVNAFWNSLKLMNFFVLLFPFIFLGLGYLIHLLYEEKKIGILLIIVGVTFAFDALLAYKIGAQIHTASYLSGLAAEPVYTLHLALRDINVYAVLFAGFVVYLIWSMILHYLLLEWERSRPVKSLIKQKKGQISDLRNQINQLQEQSNQRRQSTQDEIAQIYQEIESNEEKIANLQSLIAAQIINWSEIEQRLDTFALGWLQYVAQEAGGEQKAEEKAATVSKIVKEFKDELKTKFKEWVMEESNND
ncbi:hypothetical protein ACX8XN_18570 [Calditrichota bacterium GD2]